MLRIFLFVSLLLAGRQSLTMAQGVMLDDSVGAVSMPKRVFTIEQLFELVESNSKVVSAQKECAEAAAYGVEAAMSKRLPDVDVSLSMSYIGNALMTDRNFSNVHGLRSPHLGNDFSLQAQQVVYAGGAIDAGVRMAQLGKKKADAGVRMTRQRVRFITLGQFLDLCKVDNRMLVYEKNIELTKRLIADIKERQLQGMALKNDITRYELQMESLKLELTSLRNTRSILNHQLCNTLGLDADVCIVPDDKLANGVFGKDGEWHWQAVAAASSPQLELSGLDVHIAEQNEKLAKSDMLPKVAIVAANNFNGPVLFELPPVNKNLNVWYLGVGVKYSLGALYKNSKKVRQAAVEVKQAKELHGVETERLNNDVQEAYVKYLQTYVELDTQRKSVELARQNYEVMTSRYLNQLALVTDMVDASNLYLNAELQEVDARIGIVYAFYRVKYVAGDI